MARGSTKFGRVTQYTAVPRRVVRGTIESVRSVGKAKLESTTMKLPAEVERYLHEVVGCVGDVLGARLDSVVLGGSCALGDFVLPASDIDLVVAVHGPVEDARAAELATGASHEALPCPAAGLDLVVYQSVALSAMATPTPYELGLETGERWGTRLLPGGAETELAIDLAIARRHGRNLRGRSPSELISPVPRARLLRALEDTLRWHGRTIYDSFHDPTGSQAVLNACRALFYCRQGELLSKGRAATWAGEQGWSIAPRALAIRLDATDTPLARADIEPLLQHALREIEAALGDGESDTEGV